MKRILSGFYLSFLFVPVALWAEIDNRFMPVFNFAYQHYPQRRSVLNANVFIAAGNEGYIDLSSNSHVPLPEMFGVYNMAREANALTLVGKTNPLPTPWQVPSDLPWAMKGGLRAMGIWFAYEQYVAHDFSIGMRAPFMYVSTDLEFLITNDLRKSLGIAAGGEYYLYQMLNQINRELGLSAYQGRQVGIGDLDVYLRFGKVADYTLRCKHLDASIRLGALFPINDPVELDNPMAITFTGYHHKAVYGEIDFNAELKDDWRCGFWFNITKRLAKTQVRRMPVYRELPQFGALVGPAFVDPGLTVGFAPYVWLDDLREGLGARAALTMIWHQQDYWRDQRTSGPPAYLEDLIKYSDWSSEYFTVGLIYDLNQVGLRQTAAPYFYLDLDIPSRILGSDRIAKTYRLTGGFEFNF